MTAGRLIWRSLDYVPAADVALLVATCARRLRLVGAKLVGEGREGNDE